MAHIRRIAGRAARLSTVIITQTVAKGSVYIDPGATATDNYDGNITSRIVTTVVKPVDTSKRGNTGEIWYDVKDSSGNQAERVIRKVTVR